MTFPVTEHTVKTARHTTGYLACGAEKGPLLVFCHGWPELSLSWRHQLPAMAALGFRCVAPDMRGYGQSSTYSRYEDFRQELIVEDMRELLAALGRHERYESGQGGFAASRRSHQHRAGTAIDPAAQQLVQRRAACAQGAGLERMPVGVGDQAWEYDDAAGLDIIVVIALDESHAANLLDAYFTPARSKIGRAPF